MSDYIELLKKTLTASLYEESAWRRIEGPMVHQRGPVNYARRKIIRFFNRRRIGLVRLTKFDPELREKGLDWPLFGFTMTGARRVDTLERLVRRVLDENIPGDFIETGVWRGGSVILIRALLKEYKDMTRKVWCADSFEGMPVPEGGDLAVEGNWDFSDRDVLVATLEQVQGNFAKFGLLDDQVKFLKGWFKDTLPTAPIERLSLIRLDGDLYESTRDAIVNLYPKLSQGGYLIVDDYRSWPGCMKAIDEYREAHAITDEIVDIDDHAIYWRKT